MSKVVPSITASTFAQLHLQPVRRRRSLGSVIRHSPKVSGRSVKRMTPMPWTPSMPPPCSSGEGDHLHGHPDASLFRGARRLASVHETRSSFRSVLGSVSDWRSPRLTAWLRRTPTMTRARSLRTSSPPSVRLLGQVSSPPVLILPHVDSIDPRSIDRGQSSSGPADDHLRTREHRRLIHCC